MAERTKFLDKNHALLVLNSLGRFHAMGHTLLKQGLISKEDFPPHPFENGGPVVFNLLGCGLKQLCHVIENNWPDEWNDIATRLKAQVDVVVDKVVNLMKSSKDKFLTVCHGDSWTCNMMFKYCPYDEKLPVAMKFLDFQVPFINTPMFDILYFIYVSVLHNVRRENYDELIAEYYKSLKLTLTNFGMEADALTLDQIHAELKRLKYYGFLMNLLVTAITIADEDMGIVVENFGEGCDGMTAYPPGMFNGDRYKAAVQPELRKYLEEGLF